MMQSLDERRANVSSRLRSLSDLELYDNLSESKDSRYHGRILAELNKHNRLHEWKIAIMSACIGFVVSVVGTLTAAVVFQ